MERKVILIVAFIMNVVEQIESCVTCKKPSLRHFIIMLVLVDHRLCGKTFELIKLTLTVGGKQEHSTMFKELIPERCICPWT